MFQRNLELYFDKLVIGSDLSALSYAYINKCNLLFTSLNKPYKYNEQENWKELTDLWNYLAFHLSQASYIPFPNNILNIRIEEDNLLKVIAKNNLVTNVYFKKLIISNDENIEGLPNPRKKTSYDCWAVDYFDVHGGSTHQYDFLTSNDDFVKKIYFYNSKRLFKKDKKDAISVSKIDERYLQSFYYSQSAARMKVMKMMKDNGIHGRLNGFYKGQRVYRQINIESNKRLIYPLGKNIYNSLPSNISMLYESHENILSMQQSNDVRIQKLKQYYGISR